MNIAGTFGFTREKNALLFDKLIQSGSAQDALLEVNLNELYFVLAHIPTNQHSYNLLRRVVSSLDEGDERISAIRTFLVSTNKKLLLQDKDIFLEDVINILGFDPSQDDKAIEELVEEAGCKIKELEEEGLVEKGWMDCVDASIFSCLKKFQEHKNLENIAGILLLIPFSKEKVGEVQFDFLVNKGIFKPTPIEDIYYYESPNSGRKALVATNIVRLRV